MLVMATTSFACNVPRHLASEAIKVDENFYVRGAAAVSIGQFIAAPRGNRRLRGIDGFNDLHLSGHTNHSARMVTRFQEPRINGQPLQQAD